MFWNFPLANVKGQKKSRKRVEDIDGSNCVTNVSRLKHRRPTYPTPGAALDRCTTCLFVDTRRLLFQYLTGGHSWRNLTCVSTSRGKQTIRATQAKTVRRDFTSGFACTQHVGALAPPNPRRPFHCSMKRAPSPADCVFKRPPRVSSSTPELDS